MTDEQKTIIKQKIGDILDGYETVYRPEAEALLTDNPDIEFRTTVICSALLAFYGMSLSSLVKDRQITQQQSKDSLGAMALIIDILNQEMPRP
jgi:hypothetical protein